MKSSEYILEIYEPGSSDDVWITFSSSDPFMTISAGDILNPGIWPNSRSPMIVLRVVNVEHILWETETKVKHKVLIFSQEVEGTHETRIKRKIQET